MCPAERKRIGGNRLARTNDLGANSPFNVILETLVARLDPNQEPDRYERPGPLEKTNQICWLS